MDVEKLALMMWAQERQPHPPDCTLWESWPWYVSKGELLGWPTQPPPRPRSVALSWLTPTPTPCMSCWSYWRGWSCRTKVAGAPWHRATTRYLTGISTVSSSNSVAEARGLEPDHWHIAMNIFKWSCLYKSIRYEIPSHTATSPLRLFMIFYFLFSFVGEVLGWKANMEGLGNEWNWSTWCEISKESIKSLWEKFKQTKK